MEWYEILLIVLGSVAGFVLISALFYRQFFKRFFDILLSSVGLIIMAIPMMFTAIFVRIFLGAPVIFKQERIGRNEKHFNIYKFRTMTDKRDANGELLPDPERFTKAGKLLRKTSLDEFPQLFNVLKGDISLIGPRPMMEMHLPADPDVRKKRFKVRPGITGIAQINGRTRISFAKRFEYDLEYIDHISLWKDLSILMRTGFLFIRTIFKKGANPQKEQPMDILKGTVLYEDMMAKSAETAPQSAELEREAAIADSKMDSLDEAPISESEDSVG